MTVLALPADGQMSFTGVMKRADWSESSRAGEYNKGVD